MQGWRSGESTRLPPMWPGFDSRTRRYMWVEFVVGSRPCSEGFLRVLPFSSLLTKTNISKFQVDLETVERRATPWTPLKFPFTHLFVSRRPNDRLCEIFNGGRDKHGVRRRFPERAVLPISTRVRVFTWKTGKVISKEMIGYDYCLFSLLNFHEGYCKF